MHNDIYKSKTFSTKDCKSSNSTAMKNKMGSSIKRKTESKIKEIYKDSDKKIKIKNIGKKRRASNLDLS